MSLNILYAGVSWVLLRWHQCFTFVGLPGSSGLTWALSIICLVVTARILLFPLFLKQVHYLRRMRALQPQLEEIKRKHRGDRQAQQRAVLALQQEEAVSPLAGCLPMLLQFPIFIALFHVLRHVANAASLCHPARVHDAKLSLYGFTPAQACSAADAKLFGAPLAGSLTDSRNTIESILGGTYSSMLLVTIIVVLISAAAAFWTQRLGRQSDPNRPAGGTATMQRLIGLAVPISVLVSGLFFPLGLLVYWFASNTWAMAQQWYINRFHPHVRPSALSDTRRRASSGPP